MIAGFVEPSGGRVSLAGRDLLAVKPSRRGLGVVFQSYALFPHMRVDENVAFGLEMQGVPKAERARRVADALALVGLADFAGRHPRRLSGGQQQRVALARALVIRPKVLLLDEPLSNLDANLREEMRFEIRRLHDTYKYTTIYVTHDQAEAMTTADTIVVMNRGKVEQVGSPENIYQRPRSEFVARFIGGTNIFRGRRLDDATIDCGALVLRCGVGEAAALGDTAVSVRLHDIALSAAEAPGAGERQLNEAAGEVLRQSYLGSYRDYLVGLADGQRVRVTAPLDINVPVGGMVRLRFPPEYCRALAR